MTKTVTATEARKNFFGLLDFASKPGATVRIVFQKHPPIMLLSESEFDGWMETLEIMSDADLIKQIREGEEDMRAGRGISLEAFEKKWLKKKPSKKKRK